MAKLDRKPAEHVAIAGLIIQVLGGAVCLIMTLFSRSASAWVLTFQLFVGALVWIIALMRLRQGRLADEEQGEYERLQAERAAGGARGRLFDEDEVQAFTARNRLRLLNKYFVPGFSLLVALGLILVVAVTLLEGIVQGLQMQTGNNLVLFILCVFAGITFVFFLISRYAGGMAEQVEWRPLRAPAGFMMFNTILGVATVASLFLAVLGYGDVVDDKLAFAMLALMAVLAIEILLNFILDFYRPRVEGVEERPAYDSRLLGLFLAPVGIFKTVSTTLDYQFGFKVSQTWLYRFTEQWIAPLILFDLVTLYLLTCFVIVGAEQRGVLERRGVFKEVLEPGLHVKLPWPLERVYRFNANEVKTIHLGHTGEAEKSEKLLWTTKHYDKEFNVLVASRNTGAVEKTEKDVPDVNLLVATTTVRYKVTDVKRWYYSSTEPDKLLEALCEREQIKYLAGVDLFEVMSAGREKAGSDLREAMQKAANEVMTGATTGDTGLGVQILAVGVEGMHPPVEPGIPEAFHMVVDARTALERKRLEAEQVAIKTLSSAKSDAAVEKLKAQSYYTSQVAVAVAEAQRFEAQNKAYGASPKVFQAREFFGAMSKGLQDVRKYVIGVKNLDQEHFRLNLEDPADYDLGAIPYAKPE